MYAIIKNDIIIGGANDLKTAQWSINGTDATFVQVPDDFTIHGYKIINGEIVKKTESDYLYEQQLQEVLLTRKLTYPSLSDQFDMLWHSMDKNESLRIEPFYSSIKEIKDKNPKPPEK